MLRSATPPVVGHRKLSTPLDKFIHAMRLHPTEVTKVAARVARRHGIRKISRTQLFNIRRGAQATEGTILLIVATLEEMTGYALQASDLFNVEPRRVGDTRRRRSGEVWRISIFSPSGFGPPLLMRDSHAPLETVSVRLERLYFEHAPLLRTTAKFRHRIPPEDVDELVHDVFVSWLERQPRVDDMRAYLLAATNNACMYYWRKRARERPLLDEHEETADESTVTAHDRWIVHLSLGATLAQLGPKCRETLHRYYLEQQTPESIAMNLDTTKRYVFQLLHTCRKRAREIYRRLTEPHV